MKNCILICLAALLLGACGSSEPLQVLTPAAQAAMFSKLRGEYIVKDSRNNAAKIYTLWINVAETNGAAIVTYDQARSYKLRLSQCAIASKTQAENLGGALNDLENLIHCKIASEDQHAEMYIGRVRKNYTFSDQGMFKADPPITIKGEYLITLRQDRGSPVILSAIKDQYDDLLGY